MKIKLWNILLLALLLAACDVNAAERNNAANALFGQGNYDEAVRAYQAAQVTSPDLPQPYFNAAIALVHIGRLAEARAAVEQALKTADNELIAAAYYNLGNIDFMMERYEEAVEAYQQALLRDPDDADARYNLELALKRISPPPATSIPQSELPQTPTGDVGDEDQIATPSPLSATPTPQTNQEGEVQSALTQDEAGQLLDSIQQNQPLLDTHLQSLPDTPPEKDW